MTAALSRLRHDGAEAECVAGGDCDVYSEIWRSYVTLCVGGNAGGGPGHDSRCSGTANSTLRRSRRTPETCDYSRQRRTRVPARSVSSPSRCQVCSFAATPCRPFQLKSATCPTGPVAHMTSLQDGSRHHCGSATADVPRIPCRSSEAESALRVEGSEGLQPGLRSARSEVGFRPQADHARLHTGLRSPGSR